QIASLASQHHESHYNRAKFGLLGCPVPYLPLSAQLPDEVYQLRQRQLLNAQHQRSWWPSHSHSYPVSSQAHTSPLDLQNELLAAMLEPLCPPSRSLKDKGLKTSASHPINISMIISPELIALITSHALLSSSSEAPTVLEIPPFFTIDRLAEALSSRSAFVTSYSNLPPSSIGRTEIVTRSQITNALQSAINNSLDIDTEAGCRAPNLRAACVASTDAPESRMTMSFAVKISSPLSLQTTIDRFRPSHESPPFCMIGNLFLSSCPGKKVRLDGPVKGKTGVCRDLDADLRRVRDSGVRCVVCCLDDEELAFLGAPWSEYKTAAEKIGLDVLRLPIPEGLAPLSPESLDGHLITLIRSYTLRSIPILVHCRGGVGRAGVIACCWLMRLGLCGEIRRGRVERHDECDEGCDPSDLDEEIVRFVEKVIGYVRSRRSLKAVETYEQVQFLVDYAKYLRNGLQAVAINCP
ncbi:phosphatases II, partial [Agrocybe pediades]